MKIKDCEGNQAEKDSHKWGVLLICSIGLVLGAIGQIYESDFMKAEAELKATVKADRVSKFEFLWGRR